MFERASDTHPDIVFGKVDTEAERELAAGLRITSIPTLMVFRDGIVVYAQPGALNGSQLESLVGEVRGPDMDAIRADIAAHNAVAGAS